MMETILEFQTVTGFRRKFHPHDFLLKEVNFSLLPGFIYAIAGKNGAGKTTLFQYILEEKRKYKGNILYQGKNIRNRHAEAMETIGFISEENPFFEEQTCRKNAEILSHLYGQFDLDLFHEIMEEVGLSSAKKYCAMSRGERIKFQIAFAIAHHSTLFLFDEATASMDPVFCIDFFHLLRRLICDETRCVLLTSHNEAEIIRDTDYVAVMKDGVLSPFTESMEGISHE